MAAPAEPVLDLVSLVEQDPQLAGVLEDALHLHDSSGFDPAMGFRPGEVHADGHLIRRLVVARIMSEAYHSRTTHQYRLADPAVVREALELVRELEQELEEEVERPELPPDLFDVVEGLQPIKELLQLALQAPRPVHVLLVGGTGSAKTLLLEEIARLPRSRYAAGPNTTRAGVMDYLLGRPETRVLVVDELDKMATAETPVLLEVMDGRRSRLQYRRQEAEHQDYWCFGGCNRPGRLLPELLDRFHVEHLAPYTAAEYEATVYAALTKRERVEPDVAGKVAAWASARTRSVRAAVRLARASRGDLGLARELAPRMLGPVQFGGEMARS